MSRFVCRACGEKVPCFLDDPHGSATLPTRCPWNDFMWKGHWEEVPSEGEGGAREMADAQGSDSTPQNGPQSSPERSPENGLSATAYTAPDPGQAL